MGKAEFDQFLGALTGVGPRLQAMRTGQVQESALRSQLETSPEYVAASQIDPRISQGLNLPFGMAAPGASLRPEDISALTYFDPNNPNNSNLYTGYHPLVHPTLAPSVATPKTAATWQSEAQTHELNAGPLGGLDPRNWTMGKIVIGPDGRPHYEFVPRQDTSSNPPTRPYWERPDQGGTPASPVPPDQGGGGGGGGNVRTGGLTRFPRPGEATGQFTDPVTGETVVNGQMGSDGVTVTGTNSKRYTLATDGKGNVVYWPLDEKGSPVNPPGQPQGTPSTTTTTTTPPSTSTTGAPPTLPPQASTTTTPSTTSLPPTSTTSPRLPGATPGVGSSGSAVGAPSGPGPTGGATPAPSGAPGQPGAAPAPSLTPDEQNTLDRTYEEYRRAHPQAPGPQSAIPSPGAATAGLSNGGIGPVAAQTAPAPSFNRGGAPSGGADMSAPLAGTQYAQANTGTMSDVTPGAGGQAPPTTAEQTAQPGRLTPMQQFDIGDAVAAKTDDIDQTLQRKYPYAKQLSDIPDKDLLADPDVARAVKDRQVQRHQDQLQQNSLNTLNEANQKNAQAAIQAKRQLYINVFQPIAGTQYRPVDASLQTISDPKTVSDYVSQAYTEASPHLPRVLARGTGFIPFAPDDIATLAQLGGRGGLRQIAIDRLQAAPGDAITVARALGASGRINQKELDLLQAYLLPSLNNDYQTNWNKGYLLYKILDTAIRSAYENAPVGPDGKLPHDDRLGAMIVDGAMKQDPKGTAAIMARPDEPNLNAPPPASGPVPGTQGTAVPGVVGGGRYLTPPTTLPPRVLGAQP